MNIYSPDIDGIKNENLESKARDVDIVQTCHYGQFLASLGCLNIFYFSWKKYHIDIKYYDW